MRRAWNAIGKAKLLVAGSIVLLWLVIWLVTTAATNQPVSPRNATTLPGVSAQGTPTPDATVAALEKEQLSQQVQQLEDQHTWAVWTNLLTPLATPFSILTALIAAIFGYQRWNRERRDTLEKERKDRQAEREKLAEERFRMIIESLGSNQPGLNAGAAIMLRTFLQPDYEQFYRQTFDLAVAHLRARHFDPQTVEPLDTLSQALITVFEESFPLARDLQPRPPQFFDAAGVQLDQAYLAEADLRNAWMPRASLREAFLEEADLTEANLSEAKLGHVTLHKATLVNAQLWKAHLEEADLRGARLSGSSLNSAILKAAKLTDADLSGAKLTDADLSEAVLSNANLSGADLNRAILLSADLSNTTLRGAKLNAANLDRANLSGATLEKAKLDEAQLNAADLKRAKLSKVSLAIASLNQADLRGTNLDDVILAGAQLNGADLKGAKLHQVSLQGAKLDKVDFKQAHLSETTFRGAVLNEADFSFATLDGVNFRGVSLSGAILKETKMRNIQGLSDEQLRECVARGAQIESPVASEGSKQ